MPAILVELGFLTSADDTKALQTPVRSQQTIEAIMTTLADIKDGVPNDAPPAR
jgi:N-acetylmuramoyl-L-alanine amidase